MRWLECCVVVCGLVDSVLIVLDLVDEFWVSTLKLDV